mmetsp:Transcript_18166/g.20639  ORF Transcript_18166/g.20639 Transcript_18166/m.20639 type:complete len:678 (+) Transcript_18166:168-2201(+)
MDSKSFGIQKQIRENAQNVQDYVSDLYKWEKEVTKKDHAAKSGKLKSKNVHADAPIRNSGVDISDSLNEKKTKTNKSTVARESTTSGKTVEKNLDSGKQKKSEDQYRDTTPMPDYYKYWDKVGAQADKEEDDDGLVVKSSKTMMNKDGADSDEDESKPDSNKKKDPKEEMLKATSNAKPNTKIAIKGGRNRRVESVHDLKERGNVFFLTGEFEKAVEMYTKCLELDSQLTDKPEMKCVLYSNRANANLKLKRYKEAETDCGCALEIDSHHIKSLYRRCLARQKLDLIKLASADAQEGLKIDPANKPLLQESKKIENKLSKIRKDALSRIADTKRQPQKPLQEFQIREINAPGQKHEPKFSSTTNTTTTTKKPLPVTQKLNSPQESQDSTSKPRRRSVNFSTMDQSDHVVHEPGMVKSASKGALKTAKNANLSVEKHNIESEVLLNHQDDAFKHVKYGQDEGLTGVSGEKLVKKGDLDEDYVIVDKEETVGEERREREQQGGFDEEDDGGASGEMLMAEEMKEITEKQKATSGFKTGRGVTLEQVKNLKVELSDDILKDLPATFSELERTWRQCRKDVEQFSKYLRAIDAQNYKSIINDLLEPDLYVAIFKGLDIIVQDQPEIVALYIRRFIELPRLSLLSLSLSKSQKKVVSDAASKCMEKLPAESAVVEQLLKKVK